MMAKKWAIESGATSRCREEGILYGVSHVCCFLQAQNRADGFDGIYGYVEGSGWYARILFDRVVKRWVKKAVARRLLARLVYSVL